jgi:hypothetical protein
MLILIFNLNGIITINHIRYGHRCFGNGNANTVENFHKFVAFLRIIWQILLKIFINFHEFVANTVENFHISGMIISTFSHSLLDLPLFFNVVRSEFRPAESQFVAVWSKSGFKQPTHSLRHLILTSISLHAVVHL